MVDADEDAEGVARRLRGLKRLRIRLNWFDRLDNFELVGIERAEE